MPKIFSGIDGCILFFVVTLLLALILVVTEYSILDLFYLFGMLICFLYYLHIRN
ncbi:unknown [Clostridium sp. CAG:762]|nr:unknown [Clostridium sp. CAG:762]